VSDAGDAAFERAIARACDECGIKADDRFLVRRHLAQPTATPACCGSDCDPCVDAVIAAAELTRRILGEKPA